MLYAIRVKKHPDHGAETLFRIVHNRELVRNLFLPDEIADEFALKMAATQPVVEADVRAIYCLCPKYTGVCMECNERGECTA